jgi:hypothetical protein
MRDQAKNHGCRDPEIEFEAFRAWAEQGGHRFVSWAGAWRTRCVNHRRYPCVAAGPSALPEGFALTPPRALLALRAGCHDPAKAFEGFVAYAREHGRTAADWNASWQSWLSRHARGCPCGARPGFDGRMPLFEGDVAKLLGLPADYAGTVTLATMQDRRFWLPEQIAAVTPSTRADGRALSPDQRGVAIRRAFVAQGSRAGTAHPWGGLAVDGVPVPATVPTGGWWPSGIGQEGAQGSPGGAQGVG